ncbi:hypothetical protein BKI52_08970 [marine bacterium AO1-C]|nr:hypothetical protein BKI52_08970 [marine bacterium AO1-C]
MINFKKHLLLILLTLIIVSCNKKKDEPTPAPAPTPTQKKQVSENGDIATYNINGDQLELKEEFEVAAQFKQFEDKAKHNELWALVTKLLPADIRPQLAELIIYAADDGGVAYVAPVNDQDLSKWRMGFNLNAVYRGNLLDKPEAGYTIIHEFGHLATLHAGQIDASVREADCQSYFPGEGCSKSNAYLTPFYDKYWKDIATEFGTIGEDPTKADAFYNKYQSRFVTQYAATNPGEDIAEVFTHFVLRNDQSTGNEIAGKKINLFYDFDESKTLRTRIRKGVDFNYTQLYNGRVTNSFRKRICVRRH